MMEPYSIPPLDDLYGEVGNGGRQPLTKCRFWQHRLKHYEPFWTLNEYDHDGCYSFYKLYMQYADEYSAAKAIVGSWNYWLALREAPWFKEKLDQWNEEIEIRDRSAAKATLLEQTEEGSVTAARGMLDYYKRSKAGKPSKAEVEREARVQGGVANNVRAIKERMQGK